MKSFQVEARYEHVTKIVRAETAAKAISIVSKETGINAKTLFARNITR